MTDENLQNVSYKECRRFCLDNKPNKCEICGSNEDIVVHHKDGDQSNNKLENLAVLCRDHHARIHAGDSDYPSWVNMLPENSIRRNYSGSNRIKNCSGGLALQITIPAQESGMVPKISSPDEQSEIPSPNVHYSLFEGLILIQGSKAIPQHERAEVIAEAAKSTQSMYKARISSLEPQGNGYQIFLAGARDGGFELGSPAPCMAADQMFVISDGTDSSLEAAQDIISLRSQIATDRDA